MAKHTLRKTDFRSDVWAKTAAYVEARRAELREQLEQDADERTTAKIRGRIAELNELLRLSKAPAEVQRTGDILSTAALDPSADVEDT